MTIPRGRLLRVLDAGVRRRPTFRYLDELRRSQWWPRERVAALQASRLAELLIHARSRSAFWAERLPADLVLSPEDWRARLEEIPPLTRADVQERRLEILTVPPDACLRRSTGGSTGTPVQFFSDAESESRRLAASWRGYEWAGLGPDMRALYLWSVPPRHVRTRGLAGLRMELYHRLHGRVPFSLFELNADTVPEVARLIRRHRVHGMIAFTGAALDLAKLVAESGVPFPRLGSVIVGAEKLHAEDRRYIEAALQTRVYETYGSREFMLMAAECPEHHRLHLTAEHHVVEVLDDAGRALPPGQPGRLAVTDLTNRAFPFIRYLNGDLGALATSPCACGRGLPVLEAVSGRESDAILTASGQRISGLLFPHQLRDASGIARYQVVDHGANRIELRIVPNPGFRDVELAPLRQALATLEGGRLELRVTMVDRIAPSANGKYRLVVRETATAGESGA